MGAIRRCLALAFTVILLGGVAIIGGLADAAAADSPVVSPAVDGQPYTLSQQADGSRILTLHLNLGQGAKGYRYIASWDRKDGLWASPAEAQAAFTSLDACVYPDYNARMLRGKAAGEPGLLDPTSQFARDLEAIYRRCHARSTVKQRFVDAGAVASQTGATTLIIPLAKLPVDATSLFLIPVKSVPAKYGPGAWPCGATNEVPSGVIKSIEWCTSTFEQPVVFAIPALPTPDPTTSAATPSSPVATPTTAAVTTRAIEPKVESGFTPTVFSNLRRADSFGGWLGFCYDAARTVGVTLVLGILILLPTQMLVTVLNENRGRFGALLEMLLFGSRRRKTSPPPSGERPHGSRLPNLLKAFGSDYTGWKAGIVLLLATLIASFSDPDVGLNPDGARIFASILIAFIALSAAINYPSYLVARRYEPLQPPVLLARTPFLLLVLGTVVFARLTAVQPALIFGAILAVDYAARIPGRLSSQTALVGAAGALVIGLIAWALYTMIIPGGDVEASTLQVVSGEAASILCVEALAILPIVLLPLTFFPGRSIWHWHKGLWLGCYVIGLTAYSLVLVPMPSSWEDISTSFAAWVAVYVVYAVISLTIWLTMTLATREDGFTASGMAPTPDDVTLT